MGRRLHQIYALAVCICVFPCPAVVAQQSKTWTTTADFDSTAFKNHTMAADNELRINSAERNILPYLWVACSSRNTIVRIATSDSDPITGRTGVQRGDILGEYYAAPEGCRDIGQGTRGPSRTSVDFDGNVWVGNRHVVSHDFFVNFGHLVKLGNGLAGSEWKDRTLPGHQGFLNSAGVLDTSTGLGDIRPWLGQGVCDTGDEFQAYDELILRYAHVDTRTIRHVTVDRKNDVWVGGTFDRTLGLIDGRTGELRDADLDLQPDFPFTTYSCDGHNVGAYGGVVDRNGRVWSAHGNFSLHKILWIEPDSTPTHGCYSVPSYGVAADFDNDIWASYFASDTVNELIAPA
jgi:hypothetical protein